MLASSILIKKRDGHSLSDDEIRFLIDGYGRGEIADYQMSAFAMAVCLRGMDRREITTLTQAMLDSGDRLPRLDNDGLPRVDKHSTGGIGDKVSLVLAPLLACCGVQVPMISGRGLGITGGTLDKLEAIDGLQTRLRIAESSRVLKEVGAFIIGADDSIAPADRRLYALRDVTGTVESVPLITSSILSKKLAASLDALIIDVKTGSGAFMAGEAEAIELAESLVRVGTNAGLPTVALLSDMDQPLGRTVGNAIEVNESIDVLRGETGVVRELTVELGASLLAQSGTSSSLEAARQTLFNALDSGAAMERFERLVHAQGGRLTGPLDLAPGVVITAGRAGYISGFDSRAMGELVVEIGGGRRRKEDAVDHRVGLAVHGRIGDRIEKDQPIVTLHHPAAKQNDYVERIRGLVRIQETPVAARPLVLRQIPGQSESQANRNRTSQESRAES